MRDTEMEAAALAGAKRPREEAIEEHKGLTPADKEASASAMPLSGGEHPWTEYISTNAAVNKGLRKPVSSNTFIACRWRTSCQEGERVR